MRAMRREALRKLAAVQRAQEDARRENRRDSAERYRANKRMVPR